MYAVGSTCGQVWLTHPSPLFISTHGNTLLPAHTDLLCIWRSLATCIHCTPSTSSDATGTASPSTAIAAACSHSTSQHTAWDTARHGTQHSFAQSKFEWHHCAELLLACMVHCVTHIPNNSCS